MESKLKQSCEEMEKANDCIKKLKSDNKLFKEKIKQKNKVIL